jgi:hypothetical protein
MALIATGAQAAPPTGPFPGTLISGYATGVNGYTCQIGSGLSSFARPVPTALIPTPGDDDSRKVLPDAEAI